MTREFNLNDSIGVHVIHFAPIAVGSEIFRLIYEIYTHTTPPGGVFKEYEVWVSETYVEDHDRLDHEPSMEEILNFANRYLSNRYKHSGNIIPAENGAYLTNETGEIRGNPRTFPLKTEDKRRLVKTTLMIPEETHKWIKGYGEEKGIGMGETIRRVVADFQVGTATYQGEKKD